PGAEPTSTDYSLRLAVAPAHELAYGLLELVLADDALVEQDPDHGLQLDRHLRLVRQPVVRNRGRPVAGRLLAPARLAAGPAGVAPYDLGHEMTVGLVDQLLDGRQGHQDRLDAAAGLVLDLVEGDRVGRVGHR